MAKGKHAAALFEVIHSDKRFKKQNLLDTSGRLSTPKWWFKGMKGDRSSAAAPAAGAPEGRGAVGADGEFDPTAGATSENLGTPAAATATATATTSTPARSEVKLNPERNQISFRLTYTSAIVGAFAVVVVVALSYLIGTHVSKPRSASAAGNLTDLLQQGPAQPSVLEVGKSAGVSSTAAQAGTTSAGAAPRTGTGASNGSSGGAFAAAHNRPAGEAAAASPVFTPPPAYTDDGKGWVVGMNYVIVQSYPDEKSAQDAADVLTKNGVPAKVVKGPPGWAASNWFSVVGSKGFDRIRSDPQFTAYVDRIQRVGAQFAGNSKFKKFEPRAYKWRETR